MADIASIYNRLNAGSQYTPLSVETFGDWSMEAGDVVTVEKDGRTYQTPIMQGDLKWDGAGKVTIESTGNREREPLGKLSRRQYSGGGGGGYWNDKKLNTRIEQTEESIELEAYNREQEDTELRSMLTITAERIESEVSRATTAEGTMSSRITQLANSISLVVNGDGVVTPASIVAAINNGSSSIKLKANHIELDGETVATSLSGQTIQCNSITAWGPCTFTDGVYFGSDATFAEPIVVMGKALNLVDAEVKGNVLTITKVDGKAINFSKATSLSGEFSGLGPFVVTASPQGNTFPVYVEFAHLGSVPVVRPAESGSNTMAISLDVGTLGADGKRTVSAKAGNNVAASQELTDYADGRASVSTRPSVVNVYSNNPGTYLRINLAASALTAGKYIGITVAGTVYSVLIV